MSLKNKKTKKEGKMNQESQLTMSFIKAFKGKKLDITVRLFLPPVVLFPSHNTHSFQST